MTMKTKGFTLIELAVVLAIIAVLAAVLTPLVTGYLDQARIARAQADVRTIADALKLHQRDTGRYPIYNASGYPSTVSDGTKTVLGGPGTNPTETENWGNLATTTLATTTLEAWINGNYTAVSTTNVFPKAAFRGPYVAAIESDPWGNKYLLNAANLNSATNHAFVISGGPNGALDTARDQTATTALTVGTDDIVAVIK
jgi:prepilin-type N-terminal cleavage/methylation domain-containing protein